MKEHNLSSHIKQISLSGILLALAVVLSFATFNMGGSKIYLVGIAIFLMPLCLKFPYMIITTLTSILIADTINGWLAYTWISMIAYGGAVVIIWLSKLLKLGIFYMASLVIASAFIIFIYYVLDMQMFGKSWAIKDVVATSIQFAIVVPVVSLMYYPFKIVLKATNIIEK